jgi:hypothetical protein
MDEAVVHAGFFRDPPRRDPGRADLDEQPLSGVEERLLGVVSRTNGNLRHLAYTFD